MKTNKFPSWIILEITNRCNLKCSHCYLSSQNKGADMSETLFKKILKEIQGIKLEMLAITGGECLMNNNIKKIIEKLSPITNTLVVETNLTLMNKDMIDYLARYDNLIVQSSIEGKKNPFGRMPVSIMESILQKLKNKKIKTTLLCSANELGDEEIEYLKEISKKYDSKIGFERLIPMGRAKNIDIDKKKFNKLMKKMRVRGIHCSDPLMCLYEKKANTFVGCSAGIFACCISAQGDVFPCAKLRISVGNINNKSLSEIWNKSRLLHNLRDREKMLNIKCKTCKNINRCGGCRAHSYAKTKDIYSEDPLCLK
jgi:AdoMet-dependent heme synthase